MEASEGCDVRREEKRIVMGHGEGTTYKGVTIHHPKRWHTVTGKGLCAVMWSVFFTSILFFYTSIALISFHPFYHIIMLLQVLGTLQGKARCSRCIGNTTHSLSLSL